jgi:glycosyltransferase involved in cell wall biosynthesis
MNEKKILLFIPMYNCEKQITRVMDQIDSEILKYIDETIVINNRSTDNGENIVDEYIKSNKINGTISLLRNDENYGLGGSHKVAFDYAMRNDFTHVIVMHGDDQGSIKDILPILISEEYKKFDCMLGARFKRGSKLIGYSKFRTFGNIVYNSLFSIVVGKKIYDLGSGLNMYDVKMLENKFYEKFPDNLVFNYCMILAVNYYKHNVKFFSISWREEDQVSNVKMFRQAFKVLNLLVTYLFLKSKFMQNDHRVNKTDKYNASLISSNKVGNLNEE